MEVGLTIIKFNPSGSNRAEKDTSVRAEPVDRIALVEEALAKATAAKDAADKAELKYEVHLLNLVVVALEELLSD